LPAAPSRNPLLPATPAKVETTPAAVISRIVLLPVSLTKRFPLCVKCQSAWRIELRVRARAIRAAGNAKLAGESGDDAVRRDFSDGIVLRISHEKISVRVHDNRGWIAEHGIRTRAICRAADERLTGQRRHRVLRVQRNGERTKKLKLRKIFSFAPAHQSFVVGGDETVSVSAG
jgi:hypothetical protein